MISFDAFVVLQCMHDDLDNWRALATDRGVLDVDEKLDELMRCGVVEQVGTNLAITKIILDKLINQINQSQLINQSKQITKNKNNNIYLSAYSDSSSKADNSDYSVELSNLINRSVKMSNPAYRAVVDGHAPSRVDRAAQAYAQQLSSIDRPQFWKAYEKLDGHDQAAFNRRAARLAYRGR